MSEDSKIAEIAVEKVRRDPESEDAWIAFYNGFQPPLTYFLRYLGAGRESAREITQQTFVKLLESSPWSLDWSKLPDSSTILAWLKTVGKNLLIDRMRSPHHKQLSLEDLLDSQKVDEVNWSGFESEEINIILGCLKPEEQVFIVYRLLGFSLSQIAEVLKISKTAAGVRFHRIKEKIRNFNLEL